VERRSSRHAPAETRAPAVSRAGSSPTLPGRQRASTQRRSRNLISGILCAARCLRLRGRIASDAPHPAAGRRPESDLAILRDIAERLAQRGLGGRGAWSVGR